MKKIIIFFLALCGLSTSLNSFCWDASGHRIIASIAYDHLTPAAQTQVDRLTKVLDPNYPPFSRFLFAAVWADQLRNDDVSAFNAWHFINYPFSIDGASTQPVQPENVVWAIGQSQHTLLSTKANDEEKAVALRFLVHFVGDVHQPLHCTEVYSRQFPQGDSGNLFVIDDVNAQNLHSYWDQGVGLFRQAGQHYPLTNGEAGHFAKKIEKDYPSDYFGTKVEDLNPQNWAQQSFQIATTFAYNIKENSKPSVNYQNKGQQIVEQQVALAGYRLANLLNRIFAK